MGLLSFRGPFCALAVVVLSGCVVGQSVDIAHDASDAPKIGNGATVGVSVKDERPYVTSGEKKPDFMGSYRSGFGIPYDVSTDGKQPLADVLQRDLVEELNGLGFTAGVGSDSGKKLDVVVKHWRYDSYQNGTFEYDIDVAVKNARGESVVTDNISETSKIKGSFWTGGKGGFEREMPGLYQEIIEAVARNNDKVTSALNAR